MDQSAEQVPPAYGGRAAGVVDRDGVAAIWRDKLERAVRPVPVVVVGVDAQDAFEMAPSEDEDPIETVAADGAHPALGERVRVRRLDRRPDHLDPYGGEQRVEGASELAVPIAEQELQPIDPCARIQNLWGS